MNRLNYPLAGLFTLMFACGSVDDADRNQPLDFVSDDTKVPTPGGDDSKTPPTRDGEVTVDDGANQGDDECRPSDCEFTTYNLDVVVGDQFVLDHFVECEGGPSDYVFAYEDGEDWNLDVFNSGGLVSISRTDLLGGNKSEGEYRFSMFDAAGDELDHMTIRISDDDDSDIRLEHAQPMPAGQPGACGPAEGGGAGEPDGDGADQELR